MAHHSPFFLTAEDRDLIGATASRDPLGILPIWSARGRDLVPHLTEQTVRAEGFQLLITAFWLWSQFVQSKPQFQGEQKAFFVLVEQVFARVIASFEENWPLPGRRRVNAQAYGNDSGQAIVSLKRRFHLLDNQVGNGIWGLYRGAAGRAGLLAGGLMTLEAETEQAVGEAPGFTPGARRELFGIVAAALDDPTKEVPVALNGWYATVKAARRVFGEMPQRAHLVERLLHAGPLTTRLADRLRSRATPAGHGWQRAFLEAGKEALPEHRETIEDVLRCERFLASTEATFLWLCARTGGTVEEAARALPEGIAEAIRDAHAGFLDTGRYPPGGPAERHRLYAARLETDDAATLLRSLVECHHQVSKERGRSPWIEIEENGRLVSNVDVAPVDRAELVPDLAWRNDYYLGPLRDVARQLQGEAA